MESQAGKVPTDSRTHGVAAIAPAPRRDGKRFMANERGGRGGGKMGPSAPSGGSGSPGGIAGGGSGSGGGGDEGFKGRRITTCSFCGKTSREVGPMVEGPNDVYICSNCTDLCQNIFKQER